MRVALAACRRGWSGCLVRDMVLSSGCGWGGGGIRTTLGHTALDVKSRVQCQPHVDVEVWWSGRNGAAVLGPVAHDGPIGHAQPGRDLGGRVPAGGERGDHL